MLRKGFWLCASTVQLNEHCSRKWISHGSVSNKVLTRRPAHVSPDTSHQGAQPPRQLASAPPLPCLRQLAHGSDLPLRALLYAVTLFRIQAADTPVSIWPKRRCTSALPPLPDLASFLQSCLTVVPPPSENIEITSFVCVQLSRVASPAR